ncbi:hypothetical protein RBSH_01050 [Rhodopirellula baltica SH28]|uniref:Uncharacterized protein n=1 Tax=Rhodopirellula baltica SH28 TaxID=993517 RepID=K5ECK0_RHOBT|nr:hypothetical protein RBSH_01050 [Rhodopirellula baltica SH28]
MPVFFRLLLFFILPGWKLAQTHGRHNPKHSEVQGERPNGSHDSSKA